MLCQQKYCIKNMAVKIPILIMFRFALLCRLKDHLFFVLSLLQLQVVLIIQALVDSFSSFQMVSACFRWFQVVLDGFSSFQLVPQMVLARFRWFQLVLDDLRSFQIFLARFSLFLTVVSTFQCQQVYFIKEWSYHYGLTQMRTFLSEIQSFPTQPLQHPTTRIFVFTFTSISSFTTQHEEACYYSIV